MSRVRSFYCQHGWIKWHLGFVGGLEGLPSSKTSKTCDWSFKWEFEERDEGMLLNIGSNWVGGVDGFSGGN